MEIHFDHILSEIKKQTIRYYEGRNTDIDELFSLLKQVFFYETDPVYELDGVRERFPEALELFTSEDSTKKIMRLSFSGLTKYEPLLRKILLIAKPQVYQQGFIDKKGFAWVARKLDLSGSINFDDETAQVQRSYTDFAYHMYITYNLRNTEAHTMENWLDSQLMTNAESIFILFLTAIEKNQNALKQQLDTLVYEDYSEYLDPVISRFEKDTVRFIHIEGKEDLSCLDPYISEDGDPDEENARKGNIDEIRKHDLPEKRMLIWADAGMGKTTTLKYLTYEDAVDFKEDRINALPVYVPLGLLINENEGIIDYVLKLTGIAREDGERMLKNGKFRLFLDAVNETQKNLLDMRKIEIQKLLNDYPKNEIIITERPERYPSFAGIPVFRLKKMDRERLIEFIGKNSSDAAQAEGLIKELDEHQKLFNIITTPLMAARCIEIYKAYGSIPSNEGTIIRQFIHSLFLREKREKKDSFLDEEKIDLLLAGFARFGLEQYGTNSGIVRNEVFGIFDTAMQLLHFDYDSLYTLDLTEKLGILVYDELTDTMVFSHQMYQDFYYSMAMKVFGIRPAVMETLTGEKAEEKLEKSVIYYIHNSSSDEQADEIGRLSDNDVVLAARTIASGDFSEDQTKTVSRKAAELIESKKEEERKSGLLALAILHEYDLFIENYEKVVVSLDSRDFQQIRAFLFDCFEYMDGITVMKLIKRLKDSEANQKYIYPFIAAALREGRTYQWKEEDYPLLKEVSGYISWIYKITKIASFHVAFNIPKECCFPLKSISLNASSAKQCQLIFDYLGKYDLPRDDEAIISYVKHSNVSKKRKFLNMLVFLKDKVSHDSLLEIARIYLKRKNPFVHDYLLQCIQEDPKSPRWQLEKTKRNGLERLPRCFSFEEAVSLLEETESKKTEKTQDQSAGLSQDQ